jgi:small subunit ribosomal protein S8
LTNINPLSDALTNLYNNEERRKRESVIWPASKLIGKVLRVIQKHGYIGEFEYIDDSRSGKFKVQLLGRINKCGSVRPHFSVRIDDLEKWEKRYLPSQDVGILIITTSKGVVSNKEARELKVGGRLLAYIY